MPRGCVLPDLCAVPKHVAEAAGPFVGVPLAPLHGLAVVEALPLGVEPVRLDAEAFAFARYAALLTRGEARQKQ